MNILVRFGTIADTDIVFEFDKHIKTEQLLWKLHNNEIILAECEDSVVGYLRLEYLWTKYPYIGLIIVQNENRRQGIGTRMLEFLENYLKKQSVNALYSSSQVNESDPQSWHRHMGFSECGIINEINEGNIGEVFFVKKLK